MKITRTSPLTGKAATFDLPICQAQIESYKAGRLIQHAFANLDPWQREFYKTGYTPEDWKRIMNKAVFAPGDRVRCAAGDGFVVTVHNDGNEKLPVMYDVQIDAGALHKGVQQKNVEKL